MAHKTFSANKCAIVCIAPFKLSTIGTRAYLLASPHVKLSLPTDITSAPWSLPTFHQKLKTAPFQTIISIFHPLCYVFYVGIAVRFYLGYFKSLYFSNLIKKYADRVLQ